MDSTNANISKLRQRQDELNRCHGETLLLEKQLSEQTRGIYISMKSFLVKYNFVLPITGPWDHATTNSNSNTNNSSVVCIQWDSASGLAFIKSVDHKVSVLSAEWELALKPTRELVKR